MSQDYNPQLEDGHTRIAHEWLEALLISDYPASVIKLCLAVARETWGWGETWREIETDRFCALLGIRKRQFYDIRNDAMRHNLISVRPSENNNGPASYAVQKMYLDWVDYSSPARRKRTAEHLSEMRDRYAERTAHPCAERTAHPCAERTAHLPIYKESNKERGKESAALDEPVKPVTDRERRNAARLALLATRDELVSPLADTDRELIDGFIANAAAENGTGTITLNREVSLVRALIALRDEVGSDKWTHGMFEANGRRAPNLTYVKKAAASHRPGGFTNNTPSNPLAAFAGPARPEDFE